MYTCICGQLNIYQQQTITEVFINYDYSISVEYQKYSKTFSVGGGVRCEITWCSKGTVSIFQCCSGELHYDYATLSLESNQPLYTEQTTFIPLFYTNRIYNICSNISKTARVTFWLSRFKDNRR